MRKKIIYTTLACLVLLGVPSYLTHGKNSQGSQTINSLEIPLVIVNVKNTSGSFIDKRDGRAYRVVKIGNQIWMAENLNYGKFVLNMEQLNNHQIEKSYYNNDSLIGKRMGALYTWDEAMDHAVLTAKEVIQGICPEGWHLPSDAEWDELCAYLDPSTQTNKYGWKGKNIAVVLIDSTQNKFNSMYAGNAVSNWFFYLNDMAYYWTSTKFSSASAYYRSLSKDSKQIYKGSGDIKIGMSVRCIKD